jgi:imidazolonepropionase-like amidohydrolase
VIEAAGKWVTPGIIDVHSHLGNYPSPGVEAHQDGNEVTARARRGVGRTWRVAAGPRLQPRAGQRRRHRAADPAGLGNLFGGRSVTLKNVPARTTQGMKFPGAPYGLKMACGENPSASTDRATRCPAAAWATSR